MPHHDISRRAFIRGTMAAAGVALLSPRGAAVAAEAAVKRTAVDQVTLGKTGLKLSRLGIGTGSNSGNVQRNLGREQFNRLVKYAYDQGITYVDTAQSYRTREWIRDAIKGIPREKLFILSKIGGTPEKPLEALDALRKEYGVDYFDVVLAHCATTPRWDDERKRVLDALAEAKEKKIIRAKGVSCHSLPALKRAVEIDWVDVHLVRVNPQGAHMDTPSESWSASSSQADVSPVMDQIKAMRAKGRGIIGMKIIGDGDFTNPEDREKSIRFAMGCGLLDAVTIGFKSPAEIDEAIKRMNAALAA